MTKKQREKSNLGPVYIRIHRDDRAALQRIADARRLSLSAVIREAILEYLQRR